MSQANTSTTLQLSKNTREVLEMLDLTETLYCRLVDYFSPSCQDRAEEIRLNDEQCNKFADLLRPIFSALEDEMHSRLDNYLMSANRKEVTL